MNSPTNFAHLNKVTNKKNLNNKKRIDAQNTSGMYDTNILNSGAQKKKKKKIWAVLMAPRQIAALYSVR